ncbi:MAG TPA: DinB family protein, partial [Symbiobacteriaceae bacterium]|nr:DinB family protein [Symbiobacteriaceae bacterium]
EEFPDLADLAARWEAVDEDLRAATADPEAIIAYRTMAGDPYRQSVAQIIQHVVNHQTYHFGQIATLLRQLGAAAPAIDLCVYDRTAIGE